MLWLSFVLFSKISFSLSLSFALKDNSIILFSSIFLIVLLLINIYVLHSVLLDIFLLLTFLYFVQKKELKVKVAVIGISAN